MTAGDLDARLAGQVPSERVHRNAALAPFTTFKVGGPADWLVLAQRSIVDWVTALLALATAAILWRFKKLPEPLIVIAAALIGLAAHPLMV